MEKLRMFLVVFAMLLALGVVASFQCLQRAHIQQLEGEVQQSKALVWELKEELLRSLVQNHQLEAKLQEQLQRPPATCFPGGVLLSGYWRLQGADDQESWVGFWVGPGDRYTTAGTYTGLVDGSVVESTGCMFFAPTGYCWVYLRQTGLPEIEEDTGWETSCQSGFVRLDPDDDEVRMSYQTSCTQAETLASTNPPVEEGLGCDHPWCCYLWGQHFCIASSGSWKLLGIGVRNCSGEPIPGWFPYWASCVPVDGEICQYMGCGGSCYWCAAYSYHCGGPCY
jgi:hypothetical protein